MSPEARRRLLQIARAAAEAAVRGEPPPELHEDHPELQVRCGVFVTLKNRGRLRGCLGHFTSEKPLWRLVAETAVASATEDYRFVGDPITPEEMSEIEIEISVLSPLQRIENPLDIELGKHGIYIRRGGRAGCFLPQVATETGWSKEEFLSYCCTHKAGLPADAWREKETEVQVFTAEIIKEQELFDSGKEGPK